MNYKKAVQSYQDQTTKGNLQKITDELCNTMTLREKSKLISGSYLHFGLRVIFGALFKGTIFYLPFIGGGCKRLGVPNYYFSDGPKGAVAGKGTAFPAAIMRGASFDTDLEKRIGQAIAYEVIAAGGNYFAGICINLVRNPRNGRSQESYGEDPFLLGEMGKTLVESVQGESVIACPKHFALNSIENLRFLESSNVDERSLREIYLPHFKKCVDAGALSMMGAYNKVNGTYCCENKHLLKDILRDEWGFDGFTMSDFIWGVHDTTEALKAGMDSEMPINQYYNRRKIKRELQKGNLSIEDLNAAVKNILSVLIRLTPNIVHHPKSVMKSEAHLKIAEEAAVKGMVLLKNTNQILPLKKETSIAIVGPFADTVNVGDKGSSTVLCKDGITAYEGLTKKFETVAVYNGEDIQKALNAASDVETVIACIGCNHEDEGEFIINIDKKMDKKPKHALGGDRDNLHLNPSHLEMLKALKEDGKKVIAVLYTGSALLTDNFEAYTDAIIMGYYGGIRFGDALASLISGEKNFSGKLPITIAKKETDYPKFLEIGDQPYEIDYEYYNGYYLFEKDKKEVSYPFGYGLSYTRFRISDVSVFMNQQEDISVRFKIKNIGTASGSEVVQVYVGSQAGQGHRPHKMLKGFRRIELDAGEACETHIVISIKDLAFYDSSTKDWKLDSKYNFYIGNSSVDAEKHVTGLTL